MPATTVYALTYILCFFAVFAGTLTWAWRRSPGV